MNINHEYVSFGQQTPGARSCICTPRTQQHAAKHKWKPIKHKKSNELFAREAQLIPKLLSIIKTSIA